MSTLRTTVWPAHALDTDRRRWFYLYIYDTEQELQAAASAYRGGEDFSKAGGVVQPVHDDPGNGFAGVIRLCRAHCYAEVVIHESVHAAAALYRQTFRRRADLGGNCGAREERLAYIVGDLAAHMVIRLQELGVWAK